MVQFPPCSSLSLLDCFLSSHLIANHKSTFFETKPLATHSLSFHILTSSSYLSDFTWFITWLTVFTECDHYPSRKFVWTPWTSSSFTSVLTTTFKSQFQVFCTVSTFPSFPWLTSFETTCSNNSVFLVVLIVYCLHYFFSSVDNSLPVSPFSSRVKSKDHHSGLSFPHSFRSFSPLFLYISCLSLPQLYLNQISSPLAACTWSVEHGQAIYTHTHTPWNCDYWSHFITSAHKLNSTAFPSSINYLPYKMNISFLSALLLNS